MRVVYIHGLHAHPAEAAYRGAWDAALRRQAYVRDIETRMVYWADIRLGLDAGEAGAARRRAHERRARFTRLRPQTNSLLGYIVSAALHVADPAIRRITGRFVTEVYLYFYGRTPAEDIRDAILRRMDGIMRESRPDVLIAHSWGSVIALDYLLNRADAPSLDTLVTLGSPLGQAYIQRHIGGASYPERVRRWLNIFDAMDPVTWPDRRIANDFAGAGGERLVRDIEIPSVYDADGRRDPHSWYGYLMSDPVQEELFRVAASRLLWPAPATDDRRSRPAV